MREKKARSSAPQKTREPRRPFTRAADFSGLLQQVQGAVEAALSLSLKREVKGASQLHPELSHLVQSVLSLSLRGGKRLRPVLAVIGARATGKPYKESDLLAASLALELLQTYFLIHDDWMDQDATRRGGPTVHVELTRTFRSKEIGESSAILAGDLALALALSQMESLQSWPALSVFNQAQKNAIFGQQLDVMGQSKNQRFHADPLLVYRLKTASYTVSGPLELGAHLGAGSPAQLGQLKKFAEPAGIAFQLRDDALGVFGDPKVTGKPRGADLTSGKSTFLLSSALKHGKPAQLRAIRKVLGKRESALRDIEPALHALREAGEPHNQAAIDRHYREAERALSGRHITADAKELLTAALSALCRRVS